MLKRQIIHSGKAGGRSGVRYNISDRVYLELKQLAQKHGIKKIILFGSRARGSFYECSDIDIAVSGGNTAEFGLDADESIHTLLKFDVVDLDGHISEELQKEIKRDGVMIYEKDR